MNKNLEKTAYGMLFSYLNGKKHSHTEIIKAAHLILQCFKSELQKNSPEYITILNSIISSFEEEIGIKIYEPDILVNKDSETAWLRSRKENNDANGHKFFQRYRRLLRENDFAEKTIESIEINCEKVLSYCADPTNYNDISNNKKRGLVIGDVQAGKTANYLGLINMACDYGYKIIVLLAGLTDSLRQQTQNRVDEGFIGAESNTISKSIKFIGVGMSAEKYFAIPLTNKANDFVKFIKENNNSTAGDYNKPMVLVIKKNGKILEQVVDWLKPGKNNISCNNILIIDDEADNASINTNKPELDPTTINKFIRQLYNNFNIASYVGYTATPFANIFIDPFDDEYNQDLFPSDFIVQLKAPSNYFGEHKVFPTEIYSDDIPRCIRELKENEEHFLPVVHKGDVPFTIMPDSMKEAILSFLLNNAIRTLRGHEFKHRSMMINISRYNNPQDKIRDVVTDYIDKLKNIIEQDIYKDDHKLLENPEMLRLYNLFDEDFYTEVRSSITWKDIKSKLLNEIRQFTIVVINNRYKGPNRFDYDNYKEKGARVIAIGGFVLSRGLTLEGLMTSYFSRNAGAYDTLLQMCRWFGYRPKYEDLCRIYISKIGISCFTAVLDAVNNLKYQISEMHKQNKKPSDFGLMVKESPETLETTMLVTARNKMRYTDVIVRQLDYSGFYPDTSKLYKDPAINNQNITLLHKFTNSLKEENILLEKHSERYMFRGVPAILLSELISNIKIPYENKKFDCQSLSEYIKDSKILTHWDVVIATGSSKKKWNVANHELPLAERMFQFRDNEKFIRIGDVNNRILDPGIFNSGLTDTQIQKLKSKKEGKVLSAIDYLSVEERKPLLAIYPLDLVTSKKDEKEKIKNNYGSSPLLGFALGFPGIKSNEKVVYRANKIKLEELSKNLDNTNEEEDLYDED